MVKQLLTSKGLVLRELCRRGGMFFNNREFQIDVASKLNLSYSRVRDLISEAKKDGLVFTEVHGKYGVSPEVMKFFGKKKEGM